MTNRLFKIGRRILFLILCLLPCASSSAQTLYRNSRGLLIDGAGTLYAISPGAATSPTTVNSALGIAQDASGYVVVNLVAGGIAITTVSGLAVSPQTGTPSIVTDGSTATDCTVGGGVNIVPCYFNGSGWISSVGSYLPNFTDNGTSGAYTGSAGFSATNGPVSGVGFNSTDTHNAHIDFTTGIAGDPGLLANTVRHTLNAAPQSAGVEYAEDCEATEPSTAVVKSWPAATTHKTTCAFKTLMGTTPGSKLVTTNVGDDPTNGNLMKWGTNGVATDGGAPPAAAALPLHIVFGTSTSAATSVYVGFGNSNATESQANAPFTSTSGVVAAMSAWVTVIPTGTQTWTVTMRCGAHDGSSGSHCTPGDISFTTTAAGGGSNGTCVIDSTHQTCRVTGGSTTIYAGDLIDIHYVAANTPNSTSRSASIALTSVVP